VGREPVTAARPPPLQQLGVALQPLPRDALQGPVSSSRRRSIRSRIARWNLWFWCSPPSPSGSSPVQEDS
jgi:hypothetical protein